jgi:hypothetical protein
VLTPEGSVPSVPFVTNQTGTGFTINESVSATTIFEWMVTPVSPSA